MADKEQLTAQDKKVMFQALLFLAGLISILYGIFAKFQTAVFGHRAMFILIGLAIIVISLVDTIRWWAGCGACLYLTVQVVRIGIVETDSTGWRIFASLVAMWLICQAVICGQRALHGAPGVLARREELAAVDQMSGIDFERYCMAILQRLGYTNVRGTVASGDQGVDIVAEKDGIKYAIQCKRYTSKLDNTPVQEIVAGKQYYGCDVAVVLTNNYFTDGAQDLASRTGVRLWDRTELNRMIEQAFPPAPPAPKKELPVGKKLKEKMQDRNKVEP